MLNLSVAAALVLATAAGVGAYEPKGAAVHYGPGDLYSGYLARPAGNGPFPALVVVHEWWGLNQNIMEQSDKLAKAGYVALALDLFGKSTADPQEAMKMVASLDQKKGGGPDAGVG